MKLVRTAAALALALAGAGCTHGDVSTGLASLARDGEPAIRTDADAYELRPWGHNGLATEIHIRFRNITNRPLAIVNCHQILTPVLQKRSGDDWIDMWQPATPMCISQPIVIRPGRVYERTIHVFGALPPSNVSPEFASRDVAGTYRMVMGSVVTDYDHDRQDFGNPVPLEFRVSNEFELRLPPP
jgi:hypothetical protein